MPRIYDIEVRHSVHARKLPPHASTSKTPLHYAIRDASSSSFSEAFPLAQGDDKLDQVPLYVTRAIAATRNPPEPKG
jgi:hypothetical protein